MNVVYSARYQMDIGPHVFPTRKYALVRDRLIADGVITPADCIEPEPASWNDLALAHTAEYLANMRDGTMSPQDTAQLELPWSQEMVEGFRLMVGGTITAARIACGLDEFRILNSEFGIHLGGGLHHAFPNHGEGFCPFNDVAVAARVLQARGIERIAIVDLDVHHGNGTAFTFESDPRVFTFSMHQQHNYPMWKPRGSLDVGLPDGAHDATFLGELERALPRVIAHRPGCLFYLAGADPYEDDQLGGLRLTKDGLRRRDRMVIDAVRGAGVPLVITLAGGYARRVEDTVAIHAATIEEAVHPASSYARVPVVNLPWQRATIQAAAMYMRERIAQGADDPKTKAIYEGLLEVLDPPRRATRIQREMAAAARAAVMVKAAAERRAADERRRLADRRKQNLGSPTGVERRRGSDRRAGRDRRNRA